MSRLFATFITALLTLLLGVGGFAVAGAAPASPASHVGYQADASDDAPDAEEDSVEPDDTVEYDLDFCGVDEYVGEDDTSGDPGADLESDADDPADDPAEEGADDEEALGCEDSADDETTASNVSNGGSQSVTLKTLLAGGSVDGGTVTMDGPGTVTREIFLPGTGASTRAFRVVTAKTKAKPTTKAAKGKLLAGSATKTVTKAGTVRLKVRLNTAGRTALRKAKRDVTITVKTVTKVKGKKAKTKTGTIKVKLKGAAVRKP